MKHALYTLTITALAFLVILVLFSSCLLPDAVSTRYEDHPWWKQTSTGDALSVEATWYLRPRRVIVVGRRGK